METKLKYEIKSGVLRLELAGNYLEHIDDGAVQSLCEAAEKQTVTAIEVSAEELQKWDSSLVAVLYRLQKTARRRQLPFSGSGLPSGLQRLLKLAFSVDRRPENTTARRQVFLERVGEKGINIVCSAHKGLSFLADAARSLGSFFEGRAVMRREDFLFALEDCGYKALPIVSLISFMVGLILAFVGAVQLKTFGAEIYVASLVTIGMTRIMGAIMTGIIMAGRTGAAYAATIGTMQVNEETDALKTMGIPIADFLVLPRMAALVLTMPLLTMWSDFMGMLGGGFVGVNFYVPFLGLDGSVDAVLAHLEHFLDLEGEKTVGFGGDWDGCDSLPKGIGGIQDMEKIYERMLQRNYPEALIGDIFYNNLERTIFMP